MSASASAYQWEKSRATSQEKTQRSPRSSPNAWAQARAAAGASPTSKTSTLNTKPEPNPTSKAPHKTTKTDGSGSKTPANEITQPRLNSYRQKERAIKKPGNRPACLYSLYCQQLIRLRQESEVSSHSWSASHRSQQARLTRSSSHPSTRLRCVNTDHRLTGY